MTDRPRTLKISAVVYVCAKCKSRLRGLGIAHVCPRRPWSLEEPPR